MKLAPRAVRRPAQRAFARHPGPPRKRLRGGCDLVHEVQVAVPRATAARPAFAPYGTPCDDLPDPNAKAICALMGEIHAMSQRLAVLEAERDANLQPAAAIHAGNLRSVGGREG